VPVSDSFSFKAGKDSDLGKFSSWMKSKYSEPRVAGQRGAAKIKDGMNPRTWIPDQIGIIIKTGKISDRFLSEISSYNDDQKYSAFSRDDILNEMKKKNPQDFQKFYELMMQARESLLMSKSSEK
jgi:hypothetical protein